jgi:hypothetical protein
MPGFNFMGSELFLKVSSVYLYFPETDDTYKLMKPQKKITTAGLN